MKLHITNVSWQQSSPQLPQPLQHIPLRFVGHLPKPGRSECEGRYAAVTWAEFSGSLSCKQSRDPATRRMGWVSGDRRSLFLPLKHQEESAERTRDVML